MALDLQIEDSEVAMQQHDIEFVVCPGADLQRWDDEPAVGQTIPTGDDDRPLLIVLERTQIEVFRYEYAHELSPNKNDNGRAGT